LYRYCCPILNFCSCYGNERGMMEDMFDTWASFMSTTKYRFIAAKSSVSQTCIPHVEYAHRMDIRVSIPLPTSFIDKLPEGFVLDQFQHVKVAFFNLGVNHEASLSASMGDVSLEERINRNAVSQISSYISATQASDGMENPTIHSHFEELDKTVAASASRKNMQIFNKAMALTHALGGIVCMACMVNVILVSTYRLNLAPHR
jgi:hypothetical protein